MNLKGRVVCCGAVSQYDASAPAGPRNLPGMVVVKRLRMEGFIVMDFAREDAKAQADLQRWVAEGKLKVVDDIVDGLENAPAALIGRSATLGSLAVGREADITIFRVADGEFEFTDSEGQTERANRHLSVLYTVRAGRVVKTPESVAERDA